MQPQTVEERRRRQRAEARRAILDATERLLLAEGSKRFSIRKLSAACGYAAPTLYHHFGDKEGLILAVLERHFAVLLRRMKQVELGRDPLENLRAIALAFVEFGKRRPTLYRLLISTSDSGQERAVPSADALRAIVQEPLGALDRQGRLGAVDPEARLQAIWALLHGLTVLQVNRPDLPWSPDLDRTAVDALLRGLLAKEPAVSRKAAR